MMSRGNRASGRPGTATFLAEVGVAAAMSFILSKLEVWKMPQGGSVSLEMLPLLYLAFARGPAQGAAAGLVTGILDIMFGGYIVHPIQAILDYPLGYAVVGMAPVLAAGRGWLRIVSGTLGGFLLQLGCYVLSGAVFFAEYAPEGVSPWVYSVTYNASFLIPELILSAIVIVYLLGRTGGRARRSTRR